MSVPIAIALASLLVSAAPSTERQDALDFSNGAMLIEESGSYGSGTSSWAAWRLTDGSETDGWATPQGKPAGSTFVWELDSTWRLDTFGLSTKNLQEAGYPGVSARKVELFVAPASGSWKSVGTFEIGKEERKEYPLPKGTQAARVKLVVLANHGNGEYTEISEVDLFGERTAPMVNRSIAGVYQTNYGPMRFVQDGDRVAGCYDWNGDVGYVQGSVSGRVAQVTWSEPKPDNRQGLATFSVGADGKLWGVWYERGALAGTWEGPRTTEDKAPKCVPARKNQVTEELQRSGKAVLYGIRFATGSDLPLPESRPTLDELASALKATPALTVEISGHTDNTASAEHNLDLSNRRAKSVVAALVKSGIAEARLQPKGYGLTRPVADNGTAQGRALNRRVEVSVVK